MPIYIYKCSTCEAEEEILQKLEDPAPEACEECKAEGTMKRIFGVSNFQLVGDGWAKDGYSG